MTILDTLADEKLFAPFFPDPTSWRSWRVFLAASFGIPLSADDLDIYARHTGRSAVPGLPAREAWVVVGRRGGKSRIAALVSVYLACFRDYRRILTPGERGTLPVIAADRRQARAVFGYITGLLESVPMLSRMVQHRTREAVELTNGVRIEVHTASFRSIRGYTLIGAVCDEIAFWRADDSANPDTEILNGLRPGMATVPGSLLLAISSPYARRGALWDVYRRYYGQDGNVLVWKGDTRSMNPLVAADVIDEAYERDAAAAEAEFGAEFRRDIEAFIAQEVVEAVVVPGRYELPPRSSETYFAFCDPSGGSSDSMTLAIAHHENGRAVLDCVREMTPPFSPDHVVREFAATLSDYGVSVVVGDRYAGEWPVDAFRRHGIEYEPAERTKSDLYMSFLPLLNSRRIELLEHPRLFRQLCGLERRTAWGGRDSVDHGPGGHDDVANAAAGALIAVAEAPDEGIVMGINLVPEARKRIAWEEDFAFSGLR